MIHRLISSGTTWEDKYGCSRAVRVDNHVVVAGTTTVDARGTVIAPGDPGRQAKFIYEKIGRALAEAGASLADVVRVRTFVVDIGRWEDVAEVQVKIFVVHDGRNATEVTMEDWRWSLPPSELARNPQVGPSSRARLIRQHAGLRKRLARRGVALLAPEAQPGAVGQVFTRDPCFAVGEHLCIGGLRAAAHPVESRRGHQAPRSEHRLARSPDGDIVGRDEADERPSARQGVRCHRARLLRSRAPVGQLSMRGVPDTARPGARRASPRPPARMTRMESLE